MIAQVNGSTGTVTEGTLEVEKNQLFLQNMKSPLLDAFEQTLVDTFTFDDNNPASYSPSKAVFDVVRAYLENPFILLKRISINRLRLLLRIGEFLYGMNGRHDLAIVPLE
jgi:hypothetical protein